MTSLRTLLHSVGKPKYVFVIVCSYVPLAHCTAFVLAGGPCGAGFRDGLDDTPETASACTHRLLCLGQTRGEPRSGACLTSASIADLFTCTGPTASMDDRRMRLSNTEQITGTWI